MRDLDRITPTVTALGLLVVRVAMLETTLVELIVRIADDTPGADAAAERTKFTGCSGSDLIKKLRRLGRDDVADPYDAIAEQRNHLVHGNGWDLPDVGYHVVQARRSQSLQGQQVAQPPREKVWQASEIEALSLQAIEFEHIVRAEVRQGRRLPSAYMVSGPPDDPWTPPRVTLPSRQGSATGQ